MWPKPNTIGMLLACGVIKKITCEAVQSIFSTASAYKVDPAVPPVFGSEAYNKPNSVSMKGNFCLQKVDFHLLHYTVGCCPL
jgi:hypothetical protein